MEPGHLACAATIWLLLLTVGPDHCICGKHRVSESLQVRSASGRKKNASTSCRFNYIRPLLIFLVIFWSLELWHETNFRRTRVLFGRSPLKRIADPVSLHLVKRVVRLFHVLRVMLGGISYSETELSIALNFSCPPHINWRQAFDSHLASGLRLCI